MTTATKTEMERKYGELTVELRRLGYGTRSFPMHRADVVRLMSDRRNLGKVLNR